MPANVITTGVQIGQSGTPANNFTIRTLDDGSIRISRGNAGAESSDVLVIDSNGNFTTAPVLGVGQTLQDVTASRVISTTYTNTTGKPIFVMVNHTVISGGTSSITLGGITEVCRYFNPTSSTTGVTFSFIVQPNQTYAALGMGILKWTEIR